MVRVTIELLPGGDASKARHMGTLEIANDGTGTADTGNYKYTISKWGKARQIWRMGSLRGFLREKLGPWDLLYRVLREAVGHRSPDEEPEGGRCANQ